MSYTYLLKKVVEIFGIYEYFIYLCNVIYKFSPKENKLLQLIQFIILIISLNYWFVRNRCFYGMASESFHFFVYILCCRIRFNAVYLLTGALSTPKWYNYTLERF